VEGAAVRIGKVECFTDSQGKFFVRLKHNRTELLAVIFEDFTAPGHWRVVSAPASAQLGTPARIVVAR